jgi:hypothetical protein
MVTKHVTPWLEHFAMHTIVTCPQLFCLLKSTASVCSKFPWFSLLMLIAIGPYVFDCMSHFTSQSLHSFTQASTQNLLQRMLFLCQCCFTLTRPRLFMMPLRDFQTSAGNSGLPGLSRCHVSSLIRDPLYFPLGPCLL